MALDINSACWFIGSTSLARPAVALVHSLGDSLAGIAPAEVTMFVVAQLSRVLLALGLAGRLFASPGHAAIRE